MADLASIQIADQRKSAACWYDAATLQERIAAPLPTSQSFVLTEAQLKRALKRRERWKSQAAFQDPLIFQARLALDSLDEQQFFTLLAESSEQLQARLAPADTPQWLVELLELLSSSSDEQSSLAPSEAQAQRPITLIDMFGPLIAPERAQLQRGIELLAQTSQALPFDATTVAKLFHEPLAQQVQSAALRAVVLEMHIARLEERLIGTTPEERFANFLRFLAQREHLYTFLQEYPVLARTLVTIVQRWSRFSLELLQHLCEDWKDICATLNAGIDPGYLVAIQGGAGDTHRGGKSVAILQFSSGFQVVYKPRSLALDQHFQALLAWINAKQTLLPLRTITILPKDQHGWIEFVEASGCNTEAEIGRFYERQGMYLALLYSLDAVDFHYENILAAGEQPVLVDLEALFHPRFQAEDEAEEVTRLISNSVLRPIMLPQRFYLEGEGAGLDLSGIGGGRKQLTPFLVAGWEDVGTDLMHAIREQREMPEGHNRPNLLGDRVDEMAYKAHFLKGFSAMYRLFVACRDELTSRILPQFADDEIRVILRATRTYAKLQHETYHPQHLVNALERERIFDHLWDAVPYQPYMRKVIAAERQDLLQGDIPLFTTTPTSKDLLSSQGKRIEDVCYEASLDFVLRRISQMDEHDLERQQWIIEASFATLSTATEVTPVRFPAPPDQLQRAEVENTQLMQVAYTVADRLKALALKSGDGINWLSISMVRETQEHTEWNVQPLQPLSLYDGLPGVILFLAYLGEITENTDYTEMAHAAWLTVQKAVHPLFVSASSVQMQQKKAHLLGAFEGLGSYIYLCAHLTALWHDTAYAQHAEALLDFVEQSIEKDRRLDLGGGAAGCIASLLCLHAISQSPRALSLAIRCGDYLLAQAQRLPVGIGWYAMDQPEALTSFIHGTTGIGLSLLKLAAVSHAERFREAALQAITYERSLFDPEHRIWFEKAGPSRQKLPVTWCRGVSGIALGRLAAREYFPADIQLHLEGESALAATIERGFGAFEAASWNPSLCHGEMGNLDVILTATQMSGGSAYCPMLQQRTAHVLRGIQERGLVTGVPEGIETPGLLTGISGLGYEMLRLAHPDRVPSVLLLAPPFRH